jgi:hypothetical protein
MKLSVIITAVYISLVAAQFPALGGKKSGTGAAKGALPAGLPAGLPKLTPKQKAAVKQVADFFYPNCAVGNTECDQANRQKKCVVGSFLRSKCNLKDGDIGCICRAKFQGAFDKCTQKGCSGKLYTRVANVQKAMCVSIIPKCAFKCLSEQPAKSGCSPLDPYCLCSAKYAKDYEGCLTAACTDPQDVKREVMVGQQMCDQLPPKCAVSDIAKTKLTF